MHIYIDSFSSTLFDVYIFSLQPHVPITYADLYFDYFRTSIQ